MDNFKKYNSIENSYREKEIERIQLAGYAKVKYAVSEKVHGCNVQLSYNGDAFNIGKRTSFLEDGETFYGMNYIMKEYENALKNIYDRYKEIIPELKQVILFGEGFGGSYPHELVERDKHASKVQKGVYYHPSNKFISFDLALEINGAEHLSYLTPKEFKEIVEELNIPHIPFKIMDSLEEALNYPNNEPSEIYKLYNLPEIPSNIREGVVIKPYDVDAWIGQSRVILKNKNEIFSEKSHEKCHDKQPQELSENLVLIINEALKYVNENRVEAVISKIGEITIKDIGKVIGLTNKDVFEDFIKDSGILNTLEKSEVKIVTKQINNTVSKIVKEHILKNY